MIPGPDILRADLAAAEQLYNDHMRRCACGIAVDCEVRFAIITLTVFVRNQLRRKE